MNEIKSLKHQFIIAMPSLNESYFDHSVIYIVEHNKDGAMGLVINLPTNITYQDLFDHLDIDCRAVDAEDRLLLRGGPVEPERCFVFDRQFLTENNALHFDDRRQSLEEIAKRDRVGDVLVIMGYSGWSPGQLEDELIRNDWLVVPSSQQILFELPYNKRWAAAAAQVGVDVARLSGETGHG